MTETSETSGVFIGYGIRMSDTLGGNVNDSILMVGDTDEIRVVYTDNDLTSDTSWDTAFINQLQSASTFALVSGLTGTDTNIYYVPGDSLYVIVT